MVLLIKLAFVYFGLGFCFGMVGLHSQAALNLFTCFICYTTNSIILLSSL